MSRRIPGSDHARIAVKIQYHLNTDGREREALRQKQQKEVRLLTGRKFHIDGNRLERALDDESLLELARRLYDSSEAIQAQAQCSQSPRGQRCFPPRQEPAGNR